MYPDMALDDLFLSNCSLAASWARVIFDNRLLLEMLALSYF